MAGRSPKTFFGPVQIATGPATVYTVPALTKAIWRFLLINNPSAAIVLLTISIGADAANARIWDTFSIPAKAAGVDGSYRDRFLYIPLEPGTIIQMAAGTNNILTALGAGDLETLG